ncbi:MAG TPA: hypothetical protein VM513_05355 [Kofleriaceae bacterium]|jgi:hypothetical protein|nr:hypothetical protein [Kofleriaceae bacterium]
MLSFEPLPQARVVRTHGQTIAPPPVPRMPREPMSDRTREVLGVIVGFFPLIAVMLLVLGLAWAYSFSGAP